MSPLRLCVLGGDVIDPSECVSVAALQALLERCADFFALVEHAPVGPSAAASLLKDRPAEVGAAQKGVVGFWDGPTMIAAVDLLRDYPLEGDWFVGLMLVSPKRRGKGLGGRLFSDVESAVRNAGATSLHLIVQLQNPSALEFWRAHGFERGRLVVQTVGDHSNQVVRMHKRLVGS